MIDAQNLAVDGKLDKIRRFRTQDPSNGVSSTRSTDEQSLEVPGEFEAPAASLTSLLIGYNFGKGLKLGSKSDQGPKKQQKNLQKFKKIVGIREQKRLSGILHRLKETDLGVDLPSIGSPKTLSGIKSGERGRKGRGPNRTIRDCFKDNRANRRSIFQQGVIRSDSTNGSLSSSRFNYPDKLTCSPNITPINNRIDSLRKAGKGRDSSFAKIAKNIQ